MRRMWLLDRTWIDAVAHIDVKGVKSKLEFMIEFMMIHSNMNSKEY